MTPSGLEPATFRFVAQLCKLVGVKYCKFILKYGIVLVIFRKISLQKCEKLPYKIIRFCGFCVWGWGVLVAAPRITSQSDTPVPDS
jgi:chromate transport protein ChrA